MKNLKNLGVLALMAIGLMAIAGTASADYVSTTTGGAAQTPTIHATNENGELVFSNAIANIECSSTSEGTVANHGPGKAISTNLNVLEITGCTNSWQTTTVSPGARSITWISGHNGTVVSNGALIHATRFGVPCNYETKNTQLGTVTGGNPATFHIEAAIPIAAGSSELCGSGNAKWKGSYVATSALYVVDS
jgi:hypothetical protein